MIECDGHRQQMLGYARQAHDMVFGGAVLSFGM
jgi:hypothetical protein